VQSCAAKRRPSGGRSRQAQARLPGRVGRSLLLVQAEVCVRRFRLVSRRCHSISTIQQLCPAPHGTVLALLRHTALQLSLYSKACSVSYQVVDNARLR